MDKPYYDVVIRRRRDGVERVYRMNAPWRQHQPDDDEDVNLFWWDEGNGACDCNRGDFFARAGGEPDQPEPACGNTEYLVLRFILPDGSVVKGPDAAVE